MQSTKPMSIGSVYDADAGRYRYYRLASPPGQPWTQNGSSVGTGVNDALPTLPLGSIPVGEGVNARGPVLQTSNPRVLPAWVNRTNAVRVLAIIGGLSVLQYLGGQKR